MKANVKIAGVNVALVLLMIFVVALGCRNNRRTGQTQTPQAGQVYKEQKALATVTSANTGGSCSKSLNGQMVNTPQVGFSYVADGKTYTSAGCTYNPQTAVGATITVCYNPSSPTGAKPCN